MRGVVDTLNCKLTTRPNPAGFLVMTECPFESGAVKCARCGRPYNVDNNTQVLPIETAKLMLALAVIPPKVLYYVLGGICDICNCTVGAVIKPNK